MRKFIFSTLTLCLFAAVALAQSQTGNLTGTVSDASGVIPGATVVVKDNQTGKEATVVTSDSGVFSVPQLSVGTYTVTITAPGHKTFTATDLKIDVGKEYALNAELEVGNVSETVTVVAGADIINSTDAQLSTTVTTRQIVELPLNGRNPLSLIQLQAGTSTNGAQATTINGQRSSFTNITRDGLNVQDNFIRANAVDFIPDRPNVDDTGEFTVVTQNAGADSGYGSSQVQLVTPRGSNEFHGAAYLYNRNSKFAANTFFRNTTRTERPFLNRNQFGGKIGGPIVPNRAFFFAAYEGFRLRQSTGATRTILLPAARTGIFTYVDQRGTTQTINLFAAPFSGATGVTGIDPTIAARVIANLPTAGNSTQAGDQLNTTGLFINRLQNQDREGFTSRIDWDITDRQTINGVFSYKKEFLLRPDVDAQQGGAGCCFGATPSGFQDAHTPFLALAWRWSPITSITNELRGGWQRSDPRFGSSETEPDFFLQLPTIVSNPESGFQTQGRNTDYYNVQDNAIWTRGSHSFRFGGQLQLFRINPFGPGAFGASTIPTYTIGGGATARFSVNSFNAISGCITSGPETGRNCLTSAQLGTLNSLVSLLGGLVGGAGQTFNVTSQTSGFVPDTLPNRNLDYEHLSFYVADQWRIHPELTLNYGLRYEYFTPLREPNGLALEPVLGADPLASILNPVGTYNFVGGNAGKENRFFKADKNNFAPVVSLAWAPNFKNNFLGSLFPGEGRTVFRGGFRISYVNDEFVRAADNALIGNQGLSQGVSLGSINTRLTTRPTIPTPTFAVPRTFAQNNLLAGNFGTVFAIDPNLQVPSTTEYNFGIEREIGWQTALEVRYVGSFSNNLIQGIDYNQVEIRRNGFLADFERARANLALTGNPACTTAGCQPLTVFPLIELGGLLGNATIQNLIRTGQPGELAVTYLVNFFGGSNQLFLANPNTGVADLLGNEAKLRYNSLQMEVRRRFTQGLALQANYTFQKALTDAQGTGQTRFEPPTDILNRAAEYGRATYDTAHVFNLNAIYELPFGRGKRWFGNVGSWANRVVGGWQLNTIMRVSTGAPISIVDPRGTLNRSGRSTFQTATTSLSKDQVKALVGVFKTPCGVFWMNPTVLNLNLDACNAGRLESRVSGRNAGAGAYNIDLAAFPGQVFFQNQPGSIGNMERYFLNGPMYLNWDISILKNIPITERVKFQIRAEAFNVLNRANFFIGQNQNVSSTTFGRIGSTFDPRIVQFVGRLEF
ncbi:MAG TPA: carboxypeptidase-like regulatory domain-containing protein [Pyrinomonadaceae bacterium]